MSEEKTTPRQAGGTAERVEAGAAADACVDLFNGLLQFGYTGDRKAVIDELVGSIHRHETNVLAELFFDASGILSFKYFAIREGEHREQIIDALPARKLNS